MPTYHELRAQAEELLRQAETLRKQERASIVKEVRARISEFGITAAELGLSAGVKAKAPAGQRAKVAPKYRDKATGETWSGRGQPPKWLQAHLNAGRSRDDFLIR